MVCFVCCCYIDCTVVVVVVFANVQFITLFAARVDTMAINTWFPAPALLAVVLGASFTSAAVNRGACEQHPGAGELGATCYTQDDNNPGFEVPGLTPGLGCVYYSDIDELDNAPDQKSIETWIPVPAPGQGVKYYDGW